MLNVETIAKLSAEEIRTEFKTPLSAPQIKFLSEALCASSWDPSLQGYMFGLNKPRQGVVMDILLKNYLNSDELSKKMIVDQSVSTINGYWMDFDIFTDVLLDNADNEGAVLIRDRVLERCTFCESLLNTMEYKNIKNHDWIESVRRAVEKNKFIDASDVLPESLAECKKLLSRYA